MFKLFLTLMALIFAGTAMYAGFQLVKYFVNSSYGSIEKGVVKNRNYRLLFETPETERDLEKMIADVKSEIYVQESLSERGIVEAEAQLLQYRKRLEQLNNLKQQFKNV